MQRNKLFQPQFNRKEIPSMLVDTGADITGPFSAGYVRNLPFNSSSVLLLPRAVGASSNPIKIIGRIVDACIEIGDRFFH